MLPQWSPHLHSPTGHHHPLCLSIFSIFRPSDEGARTFVRWDRGDQIENKPALLIILDWISCFDITLLWKASYYHLYKVIETRWPWFLQRIKDVDIESGRAFFQWSEQWSSRRCPSQIIHQICRAPIRGNVLVRLSLIFFLRNRFTKYYVTND